MGWTIVSKRKLQRRNREMGELELIISHSGNYTTGGGAALDLSDFFSEIAHSIEVDGQGFKLIGIVPTDIKTQLQVKVMEFDYNNASDGPAIERPGAAALVITNAVITVRGVQGGSLEPTFTP